MMDMKNKLVRAVAGTAVALFCVCGLTFARTSHVNLMYLGKVGQLTLAPGKYTVKVNPTSATPDMAFYQNGKLVGTTPVTVVSRDHKNSQTEVYYNAPEGKVRPITQIDLGGWKDTLKFNRAQASGLPGATGESSAGGTR
jgi:hypothetical protein